jgi:hypothetical protein
MARLNSMVKNHRYRSPDRAMALDASDEKQSHDRKDTDDNAEGMRALWR